MPERIDIRGILILGAGPIVTGQVYEFDCSGTQVCKALREEGYRVILTNSNPTTIMTDPTMADATYIEPIRRVTMARIIEKERPDMPLPTMGSQTALSCALDLRRHGMPEKFDVEIIGASVNTIDKAEGHSRFDRAVKDVGLAYPRSGTAHNMEEVYGVLERVGFPCIIRSSSIMGGTGGGIVCNREGFEEICTRGLGPSSTNEPLIDESLIGWKEYEMEVVRDKKDNCIIVCSIENFDPMGVHIDDSITVVPAQTLADKEYQIMCNTSLAALHEIGVETGDSNVQFGICSSTGRMVVIEMDPRVSRSSALASKAIGFPITKIAARLAVGCILDELQNGVAGGRTPALFEPAIDYVVTKIPCFAFEKFPKTNTRLTTQMKSVGEVMAIGRTFQESIQEALRGLEVGATSFDPELDLSDPEAGSILKRELTVPSTGRIWCVADAFRVNKSVEEVFELTRIDEWFLVQIEDLVEDEEKVKTLSLSSIDRELMYKLKHKDFSDVRLAELLGVTEKNLRSHRHELKVLPVYKRVNTCATEFATDIAYMHSTCEEECEANSSSHRRIIIFGGGPNRTGQGIEFNCCCVCTALTIREDGYETIVVNYDPETVSIDYDTSGRLYFEPVTLEDVPEIARVEQPKGVIVQYGSRTLLKLCRVLEETGVPIIGTNPDAINRAGGRGRSRQVVQHLNLRQPANTTAHSEDEVPTASRAIDYPLMARPSYVLDERAMEIVYQEEGLKHYMREAVQVSNDSPMLFDHFLNCTVEVDIDAICDDEVVVIGAIMQYAEQVGVRSGDSACSLLPYSLPQHIQDEIHEQVKKMALGLDMVDLMNVRVVVQGEDIFVIKVNPCASRIAPFISKCVGESLVKIIAHVMADKILAEVGFTQEIILPLFSVKEAMFPFAEFPDVDLILGPEMKPTDEVMGVGDSFAGASAKAQLGVSEILPIAGCTFISVREDDKPFAAQVIGNLVAPGFEVVATAGTTRVIGAAGLSARRADKVIGGRPRMVDMIKNDEVTLIINAIEGRQSIVDPYSIRRNALQHKICRTTIVAGGQATCEALKSGPEKTVRHLQGLHVEIKA